MTTPQTRLDTAVSADGTPIALHRSGAGAPLLLVHGALADHGYWDALVPLLADRCELLAIDRRGRGASGDASDYKYEREVDDLFAAVAGLHCDVDVLAHSSGAIIALRAAERGLPLRRLMLYEPPLMQYRPETQMPEGFADALDALVARGERDEATSLFLRYGVGLPEPEVQRLRTTPRWPAFVAFAGTVSCDVRVAGSYALEPRRLAAVRAPVLLLAGAMSPSWMTRATEALRQGLPDARVVELAGQAHNAVVSAPELVAAEVLAFLAARKGTPG